MSPTGGRHRTRAELLADAVRHATDACEAAGRCTASAEPDLADLEAARFAEEH